MRNAETYTLAVGEKAADRLELLNKIYNPYSQSFFNRIALKRDMKVLTIGCGLGIIDIWIAQKLQSINGTVIATDISTQQLDIAQNKANTQKITNIDFDILDATKSNRKDRFDLIYARFTLAHLPDAIGIINKLKQLLKPQGILWCEDMINSKIYSIPDNRYVKSAVNLVSDLGEKCGFNADFGMSLFPSFKQAELADISLSLAQPIFNTSPEKDLLLLSLREVGQKFIDEGVTDKDNFNLIIKGLETFNQEDSNLMALTPVLQICGSIK